MSRERISTSGTDATVRLPGEILERLGVDVGDEVEMVVVERTLIVRSVNETDRAAQIDAVTNEVIDRRKSAYEELARGAD